MVLVLLVSLATALLWLLQAYHPAWAILQQTSPLTPEQLAQLHGRTRYWHVYHNLRQLALLPLFALPTWLVYRQQGVRYADALLMHVLWNTAHTVCSLLIFGMMAGGVVSITTTGNGLAFLLMVAYLIVIGRTALHLRWIVALSKTTETILLVLILLQLLACIGI